MKQRTRIVLALVGSAAVMGVLVYASGAFPSPSNIRCLATDPPASFYIVLNKDGTFSKIE